MVPERLWYHTDCVNRGCPFSCNGPASCQAEIQLQVVQVGSCRVGGIVYCMFMFDWSALITPQKATLWTACVHFRDSYPIDVSHLSFNFLCLLLL